MNILHTPARFYPSVGGVEKYVLTLARALIRKKQDICVICAGEPGEESIRDYEGIRIKKIFSIGKIANTNITPLLPFRLLKNDADVFHTHVPTPWSADWSALISRIRKIPLIVTYHNDIAGNGVYQPVAAVYNRTALHVVLKQARCIILTNQNFKSHFLDPYQEKIFIVPNSVESSIFTPISKPMIGDIFFLSVLDDYHQYKGLDYLIAAVRSLSREFPDIKLIVGGSGPMREYYTNLSRTLGVMDNVSFVGYIPDENLAEYYNSCKLFVLPSTDPTREGFGIVLLEAMSCGRPVISTKITGVAEDIANRRAGIVVEPENTEALAQGIRTILLDNNLADNMGAAGRSLVLEKYSSEKIADQMMKIYLETVKQKAELPGGF